MVAGDRDRLARMLRNVIGNAVKYNPAATPVHVDVHAQGASAVVAVRDRGVGIPADDLPRVFERFFRASTARGIKGSGIGLSGAKAIVEQPGGTIVVERAAHASPPPPDANADADGPQRRAPAWLVEACGARVTIQGDASTGTPTRS